MNSFTKSNLLQGFIILGLTIGLAACGQQQDAPPVEERRTEG